MRAPRNGVPWTIARLRRRAFYRWYIRSARWRDRREAFAREYEAQTGERVTCLICASAWSVHRDDVHHLSYDHLGDERFEELWALCRGCHDELHADLDRARQWRKIGWHQASVIIATRLAREKATA
jgi:5-methylcytosine-specific restriction endonuclease McrA